MKRWISVGLITIFLVCTFFVSADSLATEDYDFANFTEAESVAFVEQCNIDIPDGFAENEEFPAFTRTLILQAYHYPDCAFAFNYYKTQRYAEDIRAAVRANMNPVAAASDLYIEIDALQDSKVMDYYGNWVASGGVHRPLWTGYNCYAFAINRPDQPPFYPSIKTYTPGDMSGTGSFDCESGEIDDLANIVCADLLAMGYSDVETSDTIPTINSSQELICVRKSNWDYHFMRYDLETNAWYHKPGGYAVLKYNHTPTNSRIWLGEYFAIDKVCIRLDDDGNSLQYDSEIVFITYSKNQVNVTDTVYSGAYIQRGKDVFYELNFAEPGVYDISLGADSAVEYNIYKNQYVNNAYFSTIESGYGTEDTSIISVTTGYKYYLRVNFETSLFEGVVDITVEPHEHHYTYEPCGSATHHLSVCNCGYEVQTRHVVEQTTAFRAPCIRCGQLVRVSDAGVGILGDQNVPEAA